MSYVKTKLGTRAARKIGIQIGDAFQVAPFASNRFSMIGDSRTADLHVGGGLNGRNWFNWAAALYKQSPVLVGNYGVSGLRSDQYLTNGNFEKALADSAGWLIFGYPVVNDITQAAAGYTDLFGRAITLSNVAANTVATLVAYARRATAAGMRVIMLTEPGSTAMTAAQTTAVYEFNKALRRAVAGVPGVLLYDPTRIIWNATGSSTIISKKANYSGDGTHAQILEARAVGLDFALNVLPAILPKVDSAPSSIADSVANGTTQLFRNPHYNTATGGSAGANVTLNSGALPANVTLVGKNAGAGLTVDATVQASADGMGNELKLVVSCTAATSLYINHSITVADIALTNTAKFGIELDVLAGNTDVTAYHASLEMGSDSGTKNNAWHALYSVASGPSWTGGESGLTLATEPNSFVSGSSSVSWCDGRVTLTFSAAGSITVILRRPHILKF